jgi:enolase
MSTIKKIFAREILDSRGNPTVEVEVELESGIKAVAAVPSGASTGTYEALELRDKDPKRFEGLGVLNAVRNVNEKIADVLIGMDAKKQQEIDAKMIELDGTENKSNLGANAILGVSLAVCRAAATEKNIPLYQYIAESYKLQPKADSPRAKKTTNYKLPVPMFNVINGGQHSDSGLSIQEYKIIPNGIKTFKEQLRAGSEIFHKLKTILASGGHSISVGDEGGFAPHLESNSEPLDLMNLAIAEAGYKKGIEINTGIDAAASSFFDEKEEKYIFKPENAMLSREMLINIYKEWIQKYNVISVEDGLNENDWDGWKIMNEKIGTEVLTIGDDLLVTNVERLKKAIQKKACNAVLIKVNQIGTLSETIECIKLAKKNKMKIVVSHRSGETTDDFIADLAVGIGADYIKSGSLSRGERICKYNRLLRIEEEISR